MPEFRPAEPHGPLIEGKFMTAMYAVERRAKAAGVRGADLLALRQAETRPIVDAFKGWLEEHKGLLPSDPLGQ